MRGYCDWPRPLFEFDESGMLLAGSSNTRAASWRRLGGRCQDRIGKDSRLLGSCPRGTVRNFAIFVDYAAISEAHACPAYFDTEHSLHRVCGLCACF